MLPNFVIIGAMKSGTTSLHYYLGLHPQITMSQTKELDFFVEEHNWAKGLDWYKSWFSGEYQISGEASPNYTKYPHFSGVPARMFSVVPEAKLIYILRDPVERIVSHYFHNYCQGRENRSIVEVLSNFEANHYIYCSQYYFQLKQYLPYYAPGNILVLSAEALMTQRNSTLQNVFKFLEVDSGYNCPELDTVHHLSSFKKRPRQIRIALSASPGFQRLQRRFPVFVQKIYNALTLVKAEKPVMPTRLRQDIMHYLQDDLEDLKSFSGHNFNEWQ